MKIASALQQMVFADSSRSANSMIGALKSTGLSIRRQDALTMIKSLKESDIAINRLTSNLEDSNAYTPTKIKLAKEARLSARKSAVLTSQQKSTLKSRRTASKGKTTGTVEDLENQIFNKIKGDRSEYTEFYG